MYVFSVDCDFLYASRTTRNPDVEAKESSSALLLQRVQTLAETRLGLMTLPQEVLEFAQKQQNPASRALDPVASSR